jgi:hypothetical protein
MAIAPESIMELLLTHPQLDCPSAETQTPEGLVRGQVWEILTAVYPRRNCGERRAVQRFPYPQLLYLTPLEADGVTPAVGSVVVVGKHLSERGLGFYYQHKPLPYRRMIASLEVPGGRWVGFLLDITWCRFTQHGWYDSGGRFLQAMPSPVKPRN